MTSLALLPDASTPLDHATALQAFADLLDGKAADEEARRFLVTMTERDETSIEIAAAAGALRERMIEVTAPEGAIDVCGTGGDGAHSLNVSTAVSLVVAGAGVPVAKHGNRAASSKAGAADTLEALGLDLDRASATAKDSLATLGIAFLFAQKHHPALKKLAPLRRSIGRRTIFNLVGPLANPARVRRQLIGVARPDFLPVYAGALRLLGYEAAVLVAGDEPLDELSVSGASSVIRIGACGDAEERLDPKAFGMPLHPLSALRGGDAAYNAAALTRLLDREPGAYRDAVLLNAAAAFLAAGRAAEWSEGIALAAESIDSDAAKALLAKWIAF